MSLFRIFKKHTFIQVGFQLCCSLLIELSRLIIVSLGQCGPDEEGTEIQIDFDITESMVSTEQFVPNQTVSMQLKAADKAHAIKKQAYLRSKTSLF